MALMVAASPPDVATWLRGFAPILAAVAGMRSRSGAGSPGLWLTNGIWPTPGMLSGGTGVMIRLHPTQQAEFVFYEPKLETAVLLLIEKIGSVNLGLGLQILHKVFNKVRQKKKKNKGFSVTPTIQQVVHLIYLK